MKNFFQFLTEAKVSQATQRAQSMGLVSDGHGDWYNKRGEFEAKTKATPYGPLTFYNKREKPGKDPKQTDKEKSIPSSQYNDPAILQQQAQAQPQQIPQEVAADPQLQGQVPQELPPVQYLPVPKTKGNLTIAFGRFNPPTIGHGQLMDTAALAASQDPGGQYLIFPSRSQDKKKNPLDPDTKIAYMQSFFPQHAQNIVNDPSIVTIFDALKLAHNTGYSGVKIVGGVDRIKEFEKLSNQYNGQFYNFDNIQMIPSLGTDPDADGLDLFSSSRMRLAAAEGDFKTFKAGLPPEIKPSQAKEMFYILRGSMNVSEGYEVWEIAPEMDYKNLRENYIKENIFKIGNLVENLNTGLVGKIIRRGTNYLICVTEEGQMFKSWIKDLNEYTEVKMDSPMRDNIHPNTLVGTLGMFKHFASMTPGAIGTGKENLQYGGRAYGIEFINKYRKKKK